MRNIFQSMVLGPRCKKIKWHWSHWRSCHPMAFLHRSNASSKSAKASWALPPRSLTSDAMANGKRKHLKRHCRPLSKFSLRSYKLDILYYINVYCIVACEQCQPFLFCCISIVKDFNTSCFISTSSMCQVTKARFFRMAGSSLGATDFRRRHLWSKSFSSSSALLKAAWISFEHLSKVFRATFCQTTRNSNGYWNHTKYQKFERKLRSSTIDIQLLCHFPCHFPCHLCTFPIRTPWPWKGSLQCAVPTRGHFASSPRLPHPDPPDPKPPQPT